MTSEEILFQKFENSSQEAVRLNLAISGYFQENTHDVIREKYEAYLRRRIRPTLEALIAADDLTNLQKLENSGWLSAALIETGLETTIRLKKTELFVWFLNLKAEKYGFSGRNFSL